MLNFEDQYYSDKIVYIAGCDEAGRGPLCGPVVAAAVILPTTFLNDDINDSKKISEKKRKELSILIKENAIAYGIGVVSPKEIDEINIYEASRKAMLIALKNLKIKPDLILTDYMPLIYENKKAIPIVKGDAKARCIAAASILAKVTRDEIMDEYDKLYPEYNYKKNKGYPTKEHLEKIKKLGIIKGFYRESYKPVQEVLYPQIKLF